MITAQYNRYGYSVWTTEPSPRPVCHCGNGGQDSTVILDPDDLNAESLRDIRQYAIQTGKEIAQERGETWGGVERVEDTLEAI